MAEVTNKFPDGYGRLVRHQQHQILEVEDSSGGADANKENTVSAVVTPTESPQKISVSITHGANGTSDASTITLNYTQLNTVIADLTARIVALEGAGG